MIDTIINGEKINNHQIQASLNSNGLVTLSIIDKNKIKVIKNYLSIDRLSNGMFIASRHMCNHLYDANFKKVFDKDCFDINYFEKSRIFHLDLFPIKDRILMTENGDVIYSETKDNHSYNKLLKKIYREHESCLKTPENYNIKFSQFSKVYEPYCGLHAVRKNGKFGFIDTNGVVVIPIKYEYVWDFQECGIAVVENNSKVGAVDKNGKTIIPLIYSDIDEFSLGLAFVFKIEKGKKYRGMINLVGETCFESIPVDETLFQFGINKRLEDIENDVK